MGTETQIPHIEAAESVAASKGAKLKTGSRGEERMSQLLKYKPLLL